MTIAGRAASPWPTSSQIEAKETRDNLEVAVAAGFVAEVKADEARRVADKIAATLWKLVGKPAG